MLSTCIFLILTAFSMTAATSTLQHHANVNNDVLMKLVERLDRQEKEIESLKRLEFEVDKVRQENKQLKSDIVNIQLKLDAQTVSTAEQYATNPPGGSHFISKSQAQQESLMRSARFGCQQGPQGPPGRNGRDGKDGKDGKDGRDGIQQPVITLDSVKEFMRLFGYKTPLQANIGNSSGISAQGPQGLSGGFMGGDGKGGIQGPSGAKVNLGPMTLNSLKPTLGQTVTGNGAPQTGSPATTSHGGAVYIRWGRTTCATHSQLLYKGVAGGASHDNEIGGSTYLCLPQVPEWGKYLDGREHTGSYVHGVEYETRYTNENIFDGKSVYNHDAPCAVCHAQTRPSHVMIPAKKTCPAGWTTEYNGYLVSGHDSEGGGAEFVCLDAAPEVVPGSDKSKNGALFYIAEAKCGSLPCPPYVDGRELACVVCTK